MWLRDERTQCSNGDAFIHIPVDKHGIGSYFVVDFFSSVRALAVQFLCKHTPAPKRQMTNDGKMQKRKSQKFSYTFTHYVIGFRLRNLCDRKCLHQFNGGFFHPLYANKLLIDSNCDVGLRILHLLFFAFVARTLETTRLYAVCFALEEFEDDNAATRHGLIKIYEIFMDTSMTAMLPSTRATFRKETLSNWQGMKIPSAT